MFLSHQALLLYMMILLSLAATDGETTQCKGYNEIFSEHKKICHTSTNHSECDVECDEGHVCFTLYANTSLGMSRIVMKNCWKKEIDWDDCDIEYASDDTAQQFAFEFEIDFDFVVSRNFICKRTSSKVDHYSNLYQCRCCGDYCNAKHLSTDEIFSYFPPNALNTTPKHEDGDYGSGNAQVSVIASIFAVVAVLIFALAVVCAVMIRKRNQHNMLHGSDRSSVETPQSGDTQATPMVEKDRDSITKMDLNLPELAELKARGRFGCVWRAELPGQKSVAVKIFLMQDKDSWLNEEDIFTTNMVDGHPYILKFIATATRDAGVNKELWLITEFHEKGSLSDYLYNETMPLPMALNFLKTMANGLAFLHEDITRQRNESKGMKPAIAHRDFKSKNVLVKSNMTACIADFGLAIKFIPGQNTGESHGQVGTRRYMAPEVLEGAINFQRDAFLRIDMYAFALVSWEVLTRCSDLPGGATPKYQLPYEAEFGHQPSIELMTDYVVDQKKRPVIKNEWVEDKIIKAVGETIEECWDNDAEARLPAGCVEVRFQELLQQSLAINGDTSQMTSSPPIPHRLIIANPAPILSTNDTTMQNLINLQRSQLTLEEDEQALLSKEDIV